MSVDGVNPKRVTKNQGSASERTALRGTEIVDVPLVDACAEVRGVPIGLIDLAETFYG